MKKIAWILVICMALAPACLAETSAVDRFAGGISQAWDALMDMAGEAGESISGWVEDSGVAEWVENTVNDLGAWAQENGLTDWAQNTLTELTTWFDESGLKEWTSKTAGEFQAFVEENRPAVEAWLAQAGEDVRAAWDTLTDADHHTPEEVQKAYETVTESLESAGGEPD